MQPLLNIAIRAARKAGDLIVRYVDRVDTLTVKAKEKTTGKEQSIRIEASSGLNESEIQRMVKDAEEHAGEDRKRKEAIEARNRGDSLVYEVEKNLKEHGDKIESGLKGRIEEAVTKLKDALKGEDAAAMYQSASPPPPGDGAATPEGEAPPKKPGSGAVDADFEVMN